MFFLSGIVKQQQHRLDKKDVEIIRKLAKDCRASYRSIAFALGVTTTTIKLRVQKLIANNIIEKFVANVNPTLFDDEIISCIVIVRCRDPNDIARQLNLLGDLSVQVDCLGGVSVFHMIMRDEKKKKKIVDSLARSLKNAQIRNVFINKLVPSHTALNDTDLRIMKCLIREPRIKISDIAKTISLSERTIQRRLDRMKTCHLLDFTLVPNSAAIRGYIYFGMVISLDKNRYQHIIEYVYSELEEFFLRPPPVTRQEVIILNLYSDNFFDIEAILRKVESLEGVKMVEVFHAIRIRYCQTWLIREIDKRVAGKPIATNVISSKFKVI
jgi:DNA-binding Lrp family transcriptional regulator